MMHLLWNIQRRKLRRRRRKQVGKAYDMALEVANVLPPRTRVLDVGCGNGFIAHHLKALLGAQVVGIDVTRSTEAHIAYYCYDGLRFPLPDRSFDAVLLCYVLHHAQDLRAVLSEVRRSLRAGGLVVVYEDIPGCVWDRLMCWTHDLMWRGRTGRCSFRREREWQSVFAALGFEIVKERALSRWRNLAYPVRHRFYLLKSHGTARRALSQANATHNSHALAQLTTQACEERDERDARRRRNVA